LNWRSRELLASRKKSLGRNLDWENAASICRIPVKRNLAQWGLQGKTCLCESITNGREAFSTLKKKTCIGKGGRKRKKSLRI